MIPMVLYRAELPRDVDEGISQTMNAENLPARSHCFRVNVLDSRGTLSFLAPPHGLKVLAASIARGARDSGELLSFSQTYDADWAAQTRMEIMRFDEHNVDMVAEPYKSAILEADGSDHPAFRVMDPETRKRSLVPGVLGLVVFNLKERRIIQVQNNYADLRRSDRGRIRVDGEPIDMLFHYELPGEWALLP
jgi:hypothetical protein